MKKVCVLIVGLFVIKNAVLFGSSLPNNQSPQEQSSATDATQRHALEQPENVSDNLSPEQQLDMLRRQLQIQLVNIYRNEPPRYTGVYPILRYREDGSLAILFGIRPPLN